MNTLVAIVAFAVVYVVIANFDAIAGFFGVVLGREPAN